jgi:predicted transcriptional regulator of viral defense system
MDMIADPRKAVLEMLRENRIIRARDLAGRGIDRKYLTLLHREGEIERVSRGTYILADADLSANQSLAQAGKRVPSGIICLLSALRFHEIGTQSPYEVWMALPGTTWKPRVERPWMRFMRFSGPAWSFGVEEHRMDGVPVRVYSPAKTVADCFKYRNKIGLDVALEALRDVWRRRIATMDQIWEAAGACRMQRVMSPYLEFLTA